MDERTGRLQDFRQPHRRADTSQDRFLAEDVLRLRHGQRPLFSYHGHGRLYFRGPHRRKLSRPLRPGRPHGPGGRRKLDEVRHRIGRWRSPRQRRLHSRVFRLAHHERSLQGRPGLVARCAHQGFGRDALLAGWRQIHLGSPGISGPGRPAEVGIMCASPEGNGFTATFEGLKLSTKS